METVYSEKQSLADKSLIAPKKLLLDINNVIVQLSIPAFKISSH